MTWPWEQYGSRRANCQVCYDLDPECIPITATAIRPGRPSEQFCLRHVRLSQVLKEGKHVRMAFPDAAQGKPSCMSCYLIGEAIREFHGDAAMMADPGVLVYIDGVGDGSAPLRVRLMHEELDISATWTQMSNTREQRAKQKLPDFGLELYTIEGQLDNDYPALGTSLHVSPDFRSDAYLIAIRGWIGDCLDNHPLCQAGGGGGTPLPKRVVDVGPRDGSAAPFLYITKRESCPYAALSHCWGKAHLLTTTMGTIEARTRGLECDKLSKTFQEAILVTRDLGLRYLWIGSLCIVQDDAADWEEQAMEMGEIYASAHVTISATGESDGSVGLLTTPGTMEVRISASKSVFARVLLEQDAFVKGIQGSRDGSLGYPLLTRAWCFQERIMSTRVLHYTPGGVFYECRTGSRCETRAGSEPSLKSVYSVWLQAPGVQTLEDRLRVWGTVLEDYTTKMLTFQKDTLPALSAVATQMGTRGMGLYLAGLWEEGLVFSLLWEAREDADQVFGASRGATVSRFARPEHFIAPTFSWASRVGPIQTLDPVAKRGKACTSVIEASCTPKGVDPYGMVSSGFVKLRGRLTEAVFHPKACEFGRCANLYRRAYKKSSRGTHLATESHSPRCHIVAPGFPLLDIVVDSEPDARVTPGETVYCLQLVEFAETEFGTWFEATEDIFDKFNVSGIRSKRDWRAHYINDKDVEIQYHGRWAPGYQSPIRRRSSDMIRHRHKADRDAGLIAKESDGDDDPLGILKYRPEEDEALENFSTSITKLSPLSELEGEREEGEEDEGDSDDLLALLEEDEEEGGKGRDSDDLSALSEEEEKKSEDAKGEAEKKHIDIKEEEGGGGGGDGGEMEGAEEGDGEDEEDWEDEYQDIDEELDEDGLKAALRAKEERNFLTAALEDGKPSSTSGVLILRRSADGTYTRMAANLRFPTTMFKGEPVVDVTIL
ncbi:hypothetical protein DL770_009665 [Monosporascus sp. CRB-9-2]|nr:hypothetical protein DL770_009665 [Monosporascus sp. CRB-9-2]